MPTVTWARVDPARRAAVIKAAEAEFGAHGFSNGSLNVIARRARVAKGSLFQYFADKRDLYAFIADIGSQRVRSYIEDLIRELDSSRPFFEFLTDLLDAWVARKQTRLATSSAVEARLSGTFAITASRTLAAPSTPRPLVNHGVSIYPGHTVLTRISGASARASESVMVFNAPLLAA